MLDRFQQDARAAVGHARQEAARLGKRAVGTEHLLLGLLARPGHAADALKAAGADPDSLRAQVPGADAVPAGEPATPIVLDAAAARPGPADGLVTGPAADPASPAATVTVPPLTENASRAVEVALAEAERLQHPKVSSGHLLLGIINQPDSQAVQMLKIGGIHVGMLRADLLRRMESGHNPWPR
jgi:ATP-dependent Clp protease ATP-binding subunit ClpA